MPHDGCYRLCFPKMATSTSAPICASRILSLSRKRQILFPLSLNVGRTLWLPQQIECVVTSELMQGNTACACLTLSGCLPFTHSRHVVRKPRPHGGVSDDGPAKLSANNQHQLLTCEWMSFQMTPTHSTHPVLTDTVWLSMEEKPRTQGGERSDRHMHKKSSETMWGG